MTTGPRPSEAATPLPGTDSGRVAVIDVGSNSVRLVVYDRPARMPLPLFNERLMCGLGKGLAAEARLDPEAVERALGVLARYAGLIRAMEVEHVEAVGTAALREAADGPAFVARAREACGLDIRILSGAEEARYSALGVQAAAPGASGLMSDLGGGSLELVALDGDGVGPGATLPLGPLRFGLPPDTPASRGAPLIAEALATLPWLETVAGRDLYIVGGAWRALGHMEMQRNDYPLHVLHGYVVDAERMRDVAAAIAGMSRASLRQAEGVSKERLAILPLAAQVLRQLLEASRPARVVFSAYGLREGLLFDRLPEEIKRQDPLIAACRAIAEATGRFPGQADTLLDWTDPLFEHEGAAERRLRQAAALLSDSGWRAHPDYRADQAFHAVAYGPIVGLDHNERARLALMVYGRYTGKRDGEGPRRLARLMNETETRHAREVGLAFRLALTISGGVPDLLRGISIRRDGTSIRLVAEPASAHLIGEVVRRRLDGLAKAMDLKADVSA